MLSKFTANIKEQLTPFVKIGHLIFIYKYISQCVEHSEMYELPSKNWIHLLWSSRQTLFTHYMKWGALLKSKLVLVWHKACRTRHLISELTTSRRVYYLLNYVKVYKVVSKSCWLEHHSNIWGDVCSIPTFAIR